MTALFRADGTRVTESTIATSTDPDPIVTITEDLYEVKAFSNADRTGIGGLRTLFCRAGRKMRASQVALLFPAPVVKRIGPQAGLAAGGTVVTITGLNFEGVTSVTFGGTAGTALKVKNAGEVTVKTPAHAAGPVEVKVIATTRSATVPNGFVYS